ncbi:MAG: tRNA (N6-threonylcarbamoyladenosine(37)-N6)-methyltransferase TrmO, partial [Bdellovibrionota bacterium]
PIGYMRTCFKEKFGTPRQSLLVKEARGVLKLNPVAGYTDALDQLESFSHIWILFVFHQHLGQTWRPKISPPRVEMEKVGVFASRSPHRPNPIGMSVVKLEHVDREAAGGVEIHLSGVDLLDHTPVLDIKPYIAYADSVPDANPGWAHEEIARYPVAFSEASQATLAKHAAKLLPRFRELLTEMLSLDPRPTSQKKTMPFLASESQGAIFRFRVSDFDVEWEIRAREIFVRELIHLGSV